MSKNADVEGKNEPRSTKKMQLTEAINEYTIKARSIILQRLVENNVEKKLAKQVEESIYQSTKAKMRTIYTLEEAYFPTETEILTNKYPDFTGWLSVALFVSFYQSLGDTIGYYNSNWEFNYNNINANAEYTNDLIAEFIALGGINDLSIRNWKASDDTILYMATMEVLSEPIGNVENFGKKIREAYLKTLPLIENRHPGVATVNFLIEQQNIEWNMLHYNSKTIGNGSVMRSGCIGIFYPGNHNREKLIRLSVESSRITHNSATAILGAITAALFTAYALEKVTINLWPHKLLKFMASGKIDEYMQLSRPNEYPLFERDKVIFIGQWKKYVELLFSGINPKTNMRHMDNPVYRYKYLSDNFSKNCGIVGGCADDCLIMAYHALLQSNGVFEKIVVYSILHPGDSDTVGSVALSWFGAYYGSTKNLLLVGERFSELEFYDKLVDLREESISRMVRVYFYDIYMNIALKYLKQYITD